MHRTSLRFFTASTLLLSLLLFLGIATTSLANPLNGNYTIDSGMATSGTNFQSFTDFANTINSEGVSGPVTVTVVPGSGPYQEQVVINTIAGGGPNAVVTLEGSGETIRAITDTDNRHVIRLANVTYFNINNLVIERDINSTSGFYGIHIFGTGEHIHISNCEVYINGTTSTLTGGFVASGSETSILVTGDFHFISITNNFVKGGGYGASIFGLLSNLASFIVIADNVFQDFHSNGVYLRETDTAVIRDNQFLKTPESSVSSCNAIQIAQNANVAAEIYNNFIQVTQTNNGTQTMRGIYLFNGPAHVVYNNVIHNILLESGDFTAIEIRTAGTLSRIYFNTISLDHTAPNNGELAGIKESLSNTNAHVFNNLISMSQPSTGIKSALVLGSTANLTTAFNSNFNILWVPGGNVAQKGTFTPTFYPSLNSWQTVSMQDNSSLSVDPLLESLLLPKPTNLDVDDKGIILPGFPIDVLGFIRGIPPDIGAYEFGACPPPPTPNALTGPDTVCANATLVLYEAEILSDFDTVIWTVPPGATISSGAGTSAITVAFGTESGEVSVIVADSCGASIPLALTVYVAPLPEAPGLIDGPEAVCAGENGVLFSIVPVAGATSYNWTVPPNAIIFSGQGSTSLTVNFNSEATTGELSVAAANDCGDGEFSTLTVSTLALPAVTFSLPPNVDTLCLDDGAFTLTGGTPLNGTYSGTGVTNGVFDPLVAGPGAHLITYAFEDPVTGCSNEANATLLVESCSSTKETIEASIFLYPNPTSGKVWMETPAYESIAQVAVFNSLGQLAVAIQSPENYLNLENLPAGMYLLKIRLHSGKEAVQKVLLK